MLRQLSDTSLNERVDKDFTFIDQKIVKNTINDLIAKQELSATAKNLTITTPRTSFIYCLPKIHKPNNQIRPIVSTCSCPTELISSYLDKTMAPTVKTLSSSLAKTNFLSLWTLHLFILSKDEGLLVLKNFFYQHTIKELSSETLIRLAELVLTLNCFSLGGKYQKQTNGTAMGTKMGPSCVNLFVGFIEHQFFS